MQTTLLIHHIMKTGGTSVIHYLESAFPEKNIIVRLGHDKEAHKQIQRVLAMTREEKQQIKVIFGHNAHDMRRYFPNALQGAFFRHPIRRLISQYNFEHEHAEEYGIKKEKRLLLSEVGETAFLEHVLEMSRENKGFNSNFQAKTLARYLGYDAKSLSEEEVVKYLDKLEFVGLQEHLDLSVFILHKLFAFPLVPVPRMNENKEKVKIQYLPQWFTKECEERFQLDFLLYERASAKFHAQYNAMMQSSKQADMEWLEYQKTAYAKRSATQVSVAGFNARVKCYKLLSKYKKKLMHYAHSHSMLPEKLPEWKPYHL